MITNKKIVTEKMLKSSSISLEQFKRLIDSILSGEVNYRTKDNRLINFKSGTEKQLYSHIAIEKY